MKSNFDMAYEKFMKEQIAGSTGERRRRLTEVDRHAETLLLQNVWWPAFRNFNHLHAEYQVIDIRGGYRFLDYAWIIPPLWVNLEVEGFTPHTKNRRVFEDDHLRAAYLQLEGWKVIRLSYDTVKDNPRLCQQILLQFAGKWTGAAASVSGYTEEEKSVIQLAIRLQKPITVGEVCAMAGVSDRTARRWLKTLVGRGVFRPARGTQRVHAYELCAEKQELFLGM